MVIKIVFAYKRSWGGVISVRKFSREMGLFEKKLEYPKLSKIEINANQLEQNLYYY